MKTLLILCLSLIGSFAFAEGYPEHTLPIPRASEVKWIRCRNASLFSIFERGRFADIALNPADGTFKISYVEIVNYSALSDLAPEMSGHYSADDSEQVLGATEYPNVSFVVDLKTKKCSLSYGDRQIKKLKNGKIDAIDLNGIEFYQN